MEKGAERLFINVARGIAIYLMLWGHCIQICSTDGPDFFENAVFRVIYSFHMPLFMLISGYLFSFSLEKRDFRTLIVHRTQAMLQPIIMVNLLSFLLTTGIRACVNRSFSLLLGARWLADIGSSLLWFLWSVLCLSIVASVAFGLIQKKSLRCAVLVLGVGFVALFPNPEMNIFMYPFFFAGLFFGGRRKACIPKAVAGLRFASLVLFPLMLPFFGHDHYIYTTGLLGNGDWSRQIPIDLFRWMIGLVGSICVLTLLETVFALFKSRKLRIAELLFRAFAKLGEKSLQVYALSVIFLSAWLPVVCAYAVKWAGRNFWVTNIHLFNFVYMPVLAALYAAALLGLNRLLEKWRISRILFGR